MASGVNAHDSCKGTALEMPVQVRVQALSLAVATFNTGVNRNNETLQRVRQPPASVRLIFTTLPQVGGIVPVGRSAFSLGSMSVSLRHH